MNGFKFIALAVLGVVLTGCGSSPSIVGAGGDYGPRQPVDVSHIPDAVPRVEPRTKAGNKNPYTVLGKTYRVLPDSKGFTEEGIASWYGKKFHGRKTSNGEIYNMYGMTAAHKNLPIPSYVRVTNLKNNRSIVVRVNDRGPFHEGRVIDLTYSGAKKLGFIDQGTASVRVVAVGPGDQMAAVTPSESVKPEAVFVPSAAAVAGYDADQLPAASQVAGYKLPANTYLQTGAFGTQAAAEALKMRIGALTSLPVEVVSQVQDDLWRVHVGPVVDNMLLMNLRSLLESNKIQSGHVIYK